MYAVCSVFFFFFFFFFSLIAIVEKLFGVIFRSFCFVLAVLDLCCREGFSLVAVSRGYSLDAEHMFSLQWLLSRCGAWVLAHAGFSSCGSQARKHKLSIWGA